MQYGPLSDIASHHKLLVNPLDYEDVEVELYSLPAFDRGGVPELVNGRSIKSSKLLITKPSILVSKLNPETSRVWLVNPGTRPALASTEFIALEAVNVELSYLFAVCKSPNFRDRLTKLVTGTSNSHQRVPVRDFFEVQVPIGKDKNLEQQGDLITALQSRIQLSRERISMIDQVVSRTFTKFFPNVFGTTSVLGNSIDVTTGVSYTSKDFGGESQALLTLKSFGRDGGYNPAGLKAWKGAFREGQQVRAGEIVVAHTDISQAGDVLGRAIVVRESPKFETLVASMDMAVIRPRSNLTNEFLLGLTRHQIFKDYCRSQSNGTTVLHLPRRAIGEFPFTEPKKDELEKYSTIVNSLVQLQSQEEDLVSNLESLQQAKLEQWG
jgi:restriction endonuclease S subunit